MNKLEIAREEISRIDEEMAKLFARRMEAARLVAEHKMAHGLPILDSAREQALLKRNAAFVRDPVIREYYVRFLQGTMDVSKAYQQRLVAEAESEKTLRMELGARSYDIVVARGALGKAGSLLNLDRKCLIVTGARVPKRYAETVAAQCKAPVIATVESGEGSKSFSELERLCRVMLENDFHRNDCVVAVGGGKVGDLAGFAAASFMRGIDFYNLPTTVLSQVDSSIGGKTAINLCGVKNIVGAFWQPRKVLIDPDTLATLPARQISNGLAEAIKMACTSDAALFRFLEEHDLRSHIDEIIVGSLRIKKAIVEQDETEQGLRKLLNFGHTIGHGIESTGTLLHGECVGLGMLPMCSAEVRARLLPVLEKAGLPVKAGFDREAVWAAMRHDKKAAAGHMDIVTVDEIGRGEIRRVTMEELKRRFDAAYTEA